MLQLDSTVHVHLDEKRLAGYWNACKALTGDCVSCDSQTTHYDQINSLIRANNYQVRVDTSLESQLKKCNGRNMPGLQDLTVEQILVLLSEKYKFY